MSIDIQCVHDAGAALGEGAWWDDRDGVLWWVDIDGQRIHRHEPSEDKNSVWSLDESVACLAARESEPGLLIATRSGFHLFDPASGDTRALHDPEPDRPEQRFNDGCTDPMGRFWAGTMKDVGAREPVGRFYCLDGQQLCSRWFDPVRTSNGLAFSPDGTTLYFADTDRSVQSVFACDYDPESGTPGAPELFFDASGLAGRPDGATVDTDGCYWFAGVGGGQIVRLTPTGEIDRIIEMPISKPSKVMFGGPALDVLYVTTIAAEGEALAGGLFAVSGHGCQGLAQMRFAG